MSFFKKRPGFPLGNLDPRGSWLTQVCLPIGNSIGSAVFVQLTSVPNIQASEATLRATSIQVSTYCVWAMRPKMLFSFLLYFHTIILHVCTTNFGEPKMYILAARGPTRTPLEELTAFRGSRKEGNEGRMESGETNTRKGKEEERCETKKPPN